MTADYRSTLGHGSKTDAAKERAVIALLSSRSIAAAAKTAAISEKTLRRWLAGDASFQAALTDARRTAFETGMHRLQALTSRAVDTLGMLLNETKHPNVRLNAARAVVEFAVARHEAEVLVARIESLEDLSRRDGGR
jgi:hypothetical protein